MTDFKTYIAAITGIALGAAAMLGIDLADVAEPLKPSTGDAIFDVRTFCEDPETVVRDTTIVDVSHQTYELERIKDGKQELVTWNGETLGGTHWYWLDGVQQSEPAAIDSDAQACIRAKLATPTPTP